MVGDGSLPRAGVLASLRLFVSPVKPSLTQVGATWLVPVRTVCASSVLSALKSAALPPPSPYTPHSVVFQDAARSTSLSLLLTDVAWPEPRVSATLSTPPDVAVAVRVAGASSAAVSTPPGTVLALLLV